MKFILSLRLQNECCCWWTILSSSFPSAFSSNNNQAAASSAGISVPATLATTLTPTPTVTPGQSSPSLNELRNSCGPRRARVLYDYDAACSSELSLLADEVNDVYTNTFIIIPYFKICAYKILKFVFNTPLPCEKPRLLPESLILFPSAPKVYILYIHT